MRTPRNGRALVAVATAVFAISLLFPIVGSLLPPGDVPAWLGVLDVTVAAVAVALGFTIASMGLRRADDASKLAAYRLYRAVAILPLVLIAGFFLVGDRVNWSVLLLGLAWRAWLFVYVLPAALVLRRDEGSRR